MAAKPSGGSGCSLIPQLRDVTINQGVGSYARLVRGKEALARFYLSLPSCASTSASISITGGSLTVSGGGSTTTHEPFPLPASPFPVIAPYGSAPALDAPGDPRFVIPGTAFAPTGTNDSFTADFSVTLTYLAKAGRNDAGTNGTVTFSKLPGTNSAIARTVERRTSALRVLVVPMGNASLDYATQFRSQAQSAVESGMLTLSRIFPVPDGTGDLASSTGGVRYTILPTLLDVGSLLGGDGKFCGGGSNFDAIKGQLAQFLLSWNAGNSSATADRVVGVIDDAISNGSAQGCADGWSAIGTQGSWVRAITTEAPGRTGALLAMEIGHSMGLVPTNRDHTFDPYHSPNQEADGGTNRGYDIRSHTFIADDRTALRGTGTWNNATTLLEPIDYAFLLCMLGGSVTTDCSAPGTVGTATGVGAGPRFVISGTTDGTPDGTSVTESYFAGDVALTEPPASSHLSLRQLLDGATLAEYPIAVESVESLHAHPEDPTDESGSQVSLFAAVVPFDERADRIELRHHGELLYARDRGEQPVITSTQVVAGGEENYTDDAAVDDTWPMVSPDAAWVAWTEDDGEISRVVVGPIGDAGAAVALASEGGDTQPAWNPDGDELAFIRDGDVVTVAMTFPGGVPTFGAETVVYDSDPGGPPAANHPSWSPDGTHIAFDANGAIFVVEALEGEPPPEQLTFTGDASHPSWSWTPGDDRIAYQRDIASGPILLSEPITLASYVEPDGDGPIAPASHTPGAEFVVNSADDDPSDGICDASHCNLREAIDAANDLEGKDSIHFAIDGEPVTIQPLSALPEIADPVVIDGFTQPAVIVNTETPLVELDGSLAGASADGLVISAADSLVQGMVVNGFSGHGIRLTSPTGGSVIQGNYIGTTADGLEDDGNGSNGIDIFDSPNNTVGGTGTIPDTLNAWAGNLISGNTGAGVFIGLGPEASGNTVLGNFIGTNAAGSAAIANGGGVAISAPSNVIGGTVVDARNVISGNAYGIAIGINTGSSANQNLIQGNYIGTNVSGDAAVPNTGVGVSVSGQFSDNVVGGTAVGAGNLISGNTATGIRLEHVSGTIIQGNLIGTDAAGTADLGNGNMGVFTFDVSNTLIGGTTAAARNVIAGNTSNGIRTSAASTTSSADNVISGNYVGMDATGLTALPNDWGVGLTSSGVTLGGTAAGAGNVISGNVNQGVSVGGATATGNLVQGNLIGVAADGTTPAGNGANGIHVVNTSGNTIGGTAAGDGNQIAHNGENGIEVWRQDGLIDLTLDNAILGNSIHSNGRLGIDLTCCSVNENDAGDIDDGPNGHQNFPDLASAEVVGSSDLVVSGTLTSAASSSYRVEYFRNLACDNSGNGEGQIFVGFEDVTTDGSGNATLNSTFPGTGVTPGELITATATDTDGNTSEFSDCATAADGGTGTLVVNTSSDTGSGGCDETECTLREAIVASNSTVGTQTITFDIPGSGVHVIQPASQLPPLEDSTSVDATTQPGYAGSPIVELDGSLLTTGYGLVVNTGLSTIRGFAIHGFPDAGVRIDTGGGAGGNMVADSWLGLDAAGAPGTGQSIGILVFESPDNTIQDNVISGNTGAAFYGVGLFGGPSGPSVITGNVVQGNLIGVAPDGSSALPNAGHGVVVSGVSGSQIGGIEAGQGNVIANSGGAGVLVDQDATTGNAILGNSIHDNGSLGIDLGGGGSIATNDNLDADTGPNNLQNYPSVGVSDDGTAISGTLLSAQVADYRIELFRSADCDGSGNGEGDEFLGFVDVTTNADGYATFTFDASGDPISPTDVVTASATDEDGNTSEFSACAAPTATGTQVWTLDPTAPSTTQEALVADAAQPAFGADGRVAFVRDGAIHSIGADGTGLAQLTAPPDGVQDSMPSLGGIPAIARFFDNFDGGGQWDVFLLRGQVQVVTTASDDHPDDLRLDIYYQCPGSPAYDVAVALSPDDVVAGSATWSTNYDPSLACPDGTLTAIAADGFWRSDSEEAGTVASDPQLPVPTIYAPFDGRQFLQYQGISLHGGAKDAEDGEVSDAGLAWFLDGSSVGTGPSVNLSPPGAGWSSGPHTFTLRATDSDGTFVETSVEIVVLADADNDWLPTDVEADATCFGEDADSDPTNSFGDADGDSYSNLDDMHTDEGPCEAADEYSVLATFGPDILYVPSKGDEVTITVQSTNRDLRQVAGSTVRISDLSGAAVSFFATSWKVDKKGVGTALFDRQAVTAFLSDNGLVGQTVTVTVVGESLSHSWTFSGTDTFEAMAAN